MTQPYISGTLIGNLLSVKATCFHAIKTINSYNMTFKEVIQSDKPVLVDFFATWCGPCKTMSPILEQVKLQVGNAAIIVKVDVDKNKLAASEYQVQGVPTLILFQKGQPLWRQSGVVPKEGLVNIIKKYAL